MALLEVLGFHQSFFEQHVFDVGDGNASFGILQGDGYQRSGQGYYAINQGPFDNSSFFGQQCEGLERTVTIHAWLKFWQVTATVDVCALWDGTSASNRGMAGLTRQVHLRINPAYQFELWSNGAWLATCPTSEPVVDPDAPANEYLHHYAIRLVVHPTNGGVAVYRDGCLYWCSLGHATLHDTEGLITRWTMGSPEATSGVYVADVDDVVLTDGAYLGRVEVLECFARADGFHQDLSIIPASEPPIDGEASAHPWPTHWENLRDVPWPDGDGTDERTTALRGTAVDAESVPFEALTPADDPILAVVVEPWMRQRRSPDGTPTIAATALPLLRVSEADAFGPAAHLATTSPADGEPFGLLDMPQGRGIDGWRAYPWIQELNPATGLAWTEAEVNGVEGGAIGTTGAWELTSVYLLVVRQLPTLPCPESGLWGRKDGAFRQGPPQGMQYGAWRVAERAWVMQDGAWRPAYGPNECV